MVFEPEPSLVRVGTMTRHSEFREPGPTRDHAVGAMCSIVFPWHRTRRRYGYLQFFLLPAAEECEAALEAIEPLRRAVAAICITADGEVVGWE